MHANRIPKSWDGAISPVAPGRTARRAAGAAPGPARNTGAGRSAPPVRPAAPQGRTGSAAGETPGKTAGQARVRLTRRGGILAVFAISFLGLLAASVSHTGVLAGISYLSACVIAAWLVRRGNLLPIVVTAPMLFGIAVVCVQGITAAGGLLSVAGGTLVTLGNVAPWLFTGTALATIIALARGLAGEIRELRASLRGDGRR